MIEPADVGPLLDLGPHELVAVVGGGGKTTLVHHLARHLARLGPRCLLTTTTKMGFDQSGGHPVLLSPTDAQISAIDAPTVVWRAIDEPVALGVDPGQCDRWFGLVDHLVVEADGARRRPFKAPAAYEPVVPAAATLVLSVIGADAIGGLIDRCCHRPQLVAALAGCEPGDELTPTRAARVLLHPEGNRASVPSAARFVVALTKVGPDRAAVAQDLATALGAEAAAAGEEPVSFVAVGHRPGYGP